MRYLSLFSGIEAASCAWLPLGWECAAVAEIEAFPSQVLGVHYPDVPNLGDVTKITKNQIAELGDIDLVVGGFPCQDLSVAGKRKGLEHDGIATRSGLFFDAIRIVEWANPRWVVIENVPGLLSIKDGRDFAAVVGALSGCQFGVPEDGWKNCGAAVGPKGLVEWSTLDAQFFNLAQRRERLFLVRDSGDWRSRPPVLLESASLRGDSAPRRQSRKDVAPTISARTEGGGGLGTDFDLDGELVATQGGVSHSLTVGGRFDYDTETFVTHTLRADGFDASEDGTGRRTTLTLAIRGRQGEYTLDCRDDGLANAILTPNGGRGGIGVGAVAIGHTGSHANGGGQLAAQQGMAVRRLTPEECEKLQGFPPSYTAITRKNGKPAADGPRYKAIGNSMAVPVMAWIGRRIAQVDLSAEDRATVEQYLADVTCPECHCPKHMHRPGCSADVPVSGKEGDDAK